MLIELVQRVSHKLWRQIVKKERRRRIRQKSAQERDLRHKEEHAALMKNPEYVAELVRQRCMEEETQRLEEEEARHRKEEWLFRDAALHSKFLNEKRKREFQEEQKRKQEELIKKEWEEKQKTEEDKKKKQEQESLLKAAADSLHQHGEAQTHNPEPPQGYTRKLLSPPKRESCPFFSKTGACRFGVQCSREHTYPERSHTVLLPNMYTHFGMDHMAMEEKDSDIALEYSDSEIYQHFREFFEDALPEFQRFGQVIQFKVCTNASPHLRGNVYVQYMREDDALRACTLFNGRWYAGRQLTCYLITLEKWRHALCGLYWKKQCPKGAHCNFLHAYKNPGNVFWQADKDMHSFGSPRKIPPRLKSSSERNSSRHRYEKSSKGSSERVRSLQDDTQDYTKSSIQSKPRDTRELSGNGVDEHCEGKTPSPRRWRSGSSERSCTRSERSSSKSERSSMRCSRRAEKSRSKRSRSRSKDSSRLRRSRSRSMDSSRSEKHNEKRKVLLKRSRSRSRERRPQKHSKKSKHYKSKSGSKSLESTRIRRSRSRSGE